MVRRKNKEIKQFFAPALNQRFCFQRTSVWACVPGEAFDDSSESSALCFIHFFIISRD